MKHSHVLFSLIALLSLAGCKTQEDIRREKTVENLNERIQETQKSTASGNSRFLAIEEQLSRLSGQVEESNHNRSQAIKDMQHLNERLNSMEETNKKQVEYIKALTEKVNEQGEYIAEVVTSLAKMTSIPATKKKTVESSDEADDDSAPTYANGLKKYRANDLEASKEIFEQVAANKKAKKKDREGATHYLGMIEFKNKQYESAKVYFSKLFSENPDSSFAPATLLNLAKAFNQLKSKEEASLTLDELISRFPKSKEATEASKLKAKI
jgi:TolA-binding protein